MLAYVLISLPRKEMELLKYLEKEECVEEAHVVYGEYDVVCKVRVRDLEELTDFVINKIRKKFPVEGTSTLIVAK